MTLVDLQALLPILVLGAGILALMLLVAFFPYHRVSVLVTLTTLIVSLLVVPLALQVDTRQVTPLLMIDRYALFFIALMLAVGITVTLLSYDYLEGREGHINELYHGEFYLLVLLAVLGAVVLCGTRHFASLLIGIEMISISLFALIAYPVRLRHPLEAGIKYLVLTGVSSSFLFFGMALIYADVGSLEFPGVFLNELSSRYQTAGFIMLLVGIAFKLSLVPFHFWTPDVYEGAPAPVGALVSTVSKGAVMVAFLRLYLESGAHTQASATLVIVIIAILSMLIGNLSALLQNNVKRILGYSSIAHMGYLLVGLLALGPLGVETVAYYLIAYFVTMTGAFGVIAVLSGQRPQRDVDELPEYQGLFWRRPWLAGLLTLMLLSLAGIPLTIGFVGKFYLLAAGVDNGLWWLIGALIVGSIIGLYYYLRVIAVMYGQAPTVEAVLPATIGASSNSILATLLFLLISLGVYPAPLIELIQTFMTPIP